MIKCLPTLRETWVRSLGWEDSLEKENGNPLQYSCLENPMDGGAWLLSMGSQRVGTEIGADLDGEMKTAVWVMLNLRDL